MLERDEALRNSWNEIQQSIQSLSKREHDMISKESLLEKRLREITEKESQIMNRSIEVASQTREMLSKKRISYVSTVGIILL